MPVAYPNESPTYRAKRQALVTAERALRDQIESVAAQRRALPMGGELPQDYVFTGLDGAASALSSLFSPGKSTLAIYSLMFGTKADTPCPACSSVLDGLNGQVTHLQQHLDFAVVAMAPPEKLASLAKTRDWQNLQLYSAQNTRYQADYHGETADGSQIPMINIFEKQGDAIHHFWGSEAFFAPGDGHPRHVDLLWPLWNVLDLTPKGRGTGFRPWPTADISQRTIFGPGLVRALRAGAVFCRGLKGRNGAFI